MSFPIWWFFISNYRTVANTWTHYHLPLTRHRLVVTTCQNRVERFYHLSPRRTSRGGWPRPLLPRLLFTEPQTCALAMCVYATNYYTITTFLLLSLSLSFSFTHTPIRKHNAQSRRQCSQAGRLLCLCWNNKIQCSDFCVVRGLCPRGLGGRRWWKVASQWLAFLRDALPFHQPPHSFFQNYLQNVGFGLCIETIISIRIRTPAWRPF